MLPKLQESKVISKSIREQQSSPKCSTVTFTNPKVGIETIRQYQQTYQTQCATNQKLRTLLTNIQSNVQVAASVNQQEHQNALLQKEKKKWETDVQHQLHLLNLLISQNKKLKQSVNSQRNKRAIYFNIYKNLEHQIHEWELKYKSILIQSLTAEGAISKIQQKLKKSVRKMQKQTQNLKDQLSQLNQQKTGQIQFTDHIKALQSKKTIATASNIRQSKSKSNTIFVQEEVKKIIQVNLNNNRDSQVQNKKYQVQGINIDINSLISRMKQICGKNDINQCYQIFKDIDEQIQYNFQLYREQQKRQRELQQKLHEAEIKIQQIDLQNGNQQKKVTKSQLEGQQELKELNEVMRNLQQKLKEKTGINTNELPNEMISHQCFRIREESKMSKRSLQKYLQQTKKQKVECTLLLSPQEMKKKVVNSQIKMI